MRQYFYTYANYIMKRIGLLAVFSHMLWPNLTIPQANAQFGFDGDGIIEIAADKASYKGETTELFGNVIVKQGRSTIRSNKMTIYRAKPTSISEGSIEAGDITRIVATGNVSYVSPENTVTGNKGIYQRQEQEIKILGNVILKRPSGASVRGEVLFYDLEKKRARFKDEENESGQKKRIDFSIQQSPN